jgi:hypothetical protein
VFWSAEAPKAQLIHFVGVKRNTSHARASRLRTVLLCHAAVVQWLRDVLQAGDAGGAVRS